MTGEVMGKLHPHGDGAIYDALVRLAQPFTMRVPLVDGHGNFGSLDDGPAAARYTEARLAEPSMAMTEGLNEDVVDFVPNYDNQIMQPACSPRPSRTCSSTVPRASRSAWRRTWRRTTWARSSRRQAPAAPPDATLDELMEFVPGPDLPSGGTIVGLSACGTPYATAADRSAPGRRSASRTSRRGGRARRHGAAVPGRPERVIEKIKDGVQAKKLVGISDVNDLTTGTTGCGSSSASSPASTRRPCSSSSTSTPRSRTASASTTSRSSTGRRAPWASASCSTSTCGTASPWSHGARSTDWPAGASDCTSSRACSSRSSTSTRSSRSSAPPTTPRPHGPGCRTSSTCPRCRPSTSSSSGSVV